jgi:hypothetical protein
VRAGQLDQALATTSPAFTQEALAGLRIRNVTVAAGYFRASFDRQQIVVVGPNQTVPGSRWSDVQHGPFAELRVAMPKWLERVEPYAALRVEDVNVDGFFPDGGRATQRGFAIGGGGGANVMLFRGLSLHLSGSFTSAGIRGSSWRLLQGPSPYGHLAGPGVSGGPGAGGPDIRANELNITAGFNLALGH